MLQDASHGLGSEGRPPCWVVRLYDEGTLGGLDDAGLLDRFLERGDGLAFDALVHAHGPMVRGTCRRILGGGPDVDDAFQAVFLVLARRARRIRNRQALGPWLHGVATRVAIRVRTARRRRDGRHRAMVAQAELLDGPTPSPRPEAELERVDLRAALDLEISRLPERLRQVVVLCYLRDHTHEQAASTLNCPVGTVRSRLAAARVKLQDRLRRRGLVPGATALATLIVTEQLAAQTAHAQPTPEMIGQTARAATAFANRSGATGAASTLTHTLANQVLSEMMFASLRTLVPAAALVLAVGTLSWSPLLGQGFGGRGGFGAESPPPPVVALTESEISTTITPIQDPESDAIAENVGSALPDLDPETTAAIRESLSQRLDLSSNDLTDETLGGLLKTLRRSGVPRGNQISSEISLFVDHVGFGMYELSMNEPVDFHFTDVRLDVGLTLVLEQLGAVYLVRDGVLIITVPERVDEIRRLLDDRREQIAEATGI